MKKKIKINKKRLDRLLETKNKDEMTSNKCY